jgi:hypothetical protein
MGTISREMDMGKVGREGTINYRGILRETVHVVYKREKSPP